MFQHRHYTFLAAIIATVKPELRNELIETLSVAFKRDNPRFDAARFFAAAMGNPMHRKDES